MRHLSRIACAAALIVAAGCSSGGKSSSSSSSSGTSTTTTTASSASSSSTSSTSSTNSSSSGSTTASSTSSSSSSSSGSSTATSTSSSSSSTSSSGSTGTSSTASSSSTGSSGSSGGPLTFPAFCAQAQTTACTRLQGCGLLDPTSVNCAEVGTYDLFGCNGDASAKLNAGLQVFDDVAGQNCLTALSSGNACDAASLTTVSQACARLFHGNAPIGGSCIDVSDCAFPDAGPYAFANNTPQPICQTNNADVACGGTCIWGVQSGQLCNKFQDGMGCINGDCEIVTPADGGSGAWTCVGWVEDDGGACAPGTLDCDPSLYYCAQSTGVCTPYVADGGDCSIADATTQLSTPCGPSAFCQSSDGGGGICAPIGQPGDACDPLQNTPCGPFQLCNVGNFSDGGQIAACSGTQTNLGGVCKPWLNANCDGQLTCTDYYDGVCRLPAVMGEACDPNFGTPSCFLNLNCVADTDGGFSCQSLPTEGQACNSTCAPLLDCAPAGDGGNVCVPQKVLGEACDVNDYQSCGDGFCEQLQDGGTACAPLIPLGQACDANQFQAQCAGSGSCGTFWNGSDGGSLCVGWCQSNT